MNFGHYLWPETLAIGQFTSPPQFEASGGPGIAKILTDELSKLDILVKRRARLGLKGEYFASKDQQSGGPTAKITGQLVEQSGKVLFTFTREVRDTTTLSSLIGLTVALPPDKPGKDRDRRLEERIAEPKTHIRSTRISAESSSPYAIEICVSSNDQYQPRVPHDDDGFAFVKLDRGERYAVRLINDSNHDAAVTLTIDGLNMFAFSENKSYTHLIVPAKSSGVITGWHRNNIDSDVFEVSRYSKSAAAELQSTAGVGTITASFAAAWPKDVPPPEDEYVAQFGSRGYEGNATARGPRIEQRYKEVERVVGVVRASVSVRYTKPE